MATLLDTLRVLSSFDPPRNTLKGAPWDEFAAWALSNGLASLAAYNLEYRLTGADAPAHVRDRLLSVHQGTVNDNVMKLVNFKRSIQELEGRKIIILSGASFAEALYPNVAFRPVIDIDLLVRPGDIEGFTGFLRRAHFKVTEDPELKVRGEVALTDTRTVIFVHTSLLGGPPTQVENALFERAVPMKVYGPSAYRPALEDAILTVVVEQARAGFQLPMLTFVDLRELLLGAPFLGGIYSRRPDMALVKARAKEWGMERALYASLSICARLFPETKAAVDAGMPDLKGTSKALVDRLVVAPVSSLQTRTLKGSERIRRWLTRRG